MIPDCWEELKHQLCKALGMINVVLADELIAAIAIGFVNADRSFRQWNAERVCFRIFEFHHYDHFAVARFAVR